VIYVDEAPDEELKASDVLVDDLLKCYFSRGHQMRRTGLVRVN